MHAIDGIVCWRVKRFSINCVDGQFEWGAVEYAAVSADYKTQDVGQTRRFECSGNAACFGKTRQCLRFEEINTCLG